MAFDQGLVDWVAEAMEPIGIVTQKRLFRGAALYLDGIAFAILAFDALWFKADAETDAIWDAAECPRFGFQARGSLRRGARPVGAGGSGP